MTIGAALRRAAENFPSNPAICSIFQGGLALTYAALDAMSDQVAAGLIAGGVKAGDRVAIWSANRWEWLVAHHGAVRAGAILVPVNPAFRAEEARHILADSGAVLLFSPRSFRGYSYLSAITALRDVLPALRTVVLFGDEAIPAGMSGWDDFLASGSTVAREEIRAREAEVACDAPCHLQYTSGTTGRPKGALLTHRGILNNGYFVGLRQRLGPKDSICLPVPFFHCFGIVLGALAAVAHGCEIVLPGESFDPLETLKAVEGRRCTSLYGVPMMFIAMLGQPGLAALDLGALRTGAIGAAPCPLPTMNAIVDTLNMREITVVYGMTETSPISFQSRADDGAEVRVSTVGAVQPHVEAKVVDPSSGATLPRGQRGELCIRGYSVMRGYWNRPEATAEAIDADGWMHSGDLAVMRPDGYAQIVGRLKDTIIRGGENIYPREVEEFLLTLPEVSDAYVFGVPSQVYGEEVCAWVRLKPGSAAVAPQIQDQCKGRIATYKIPRVVRIVAEFPATASGKVQKFRMREMELEHRTLEERRPA
ncbi:AMP-binding protein [Xanthobacter pseudotagetidis]|uniref:AMP-binding protein n=1 Tax=Xanthobacter pseudotagetidis TaxID=3119911 RepID=UPI003727DC8F